MGASVLPLNPAAGACESDEALVRACLNGQREAFAKLAERYHRRVFGLIVYLAQDPDAAEDLTQDVFLRAYRSLAQCRDPRQIVAWLDGIARNRVREWLRTKGRKMVSIEALSEEDSAVQDRTCTAPFANDARAERLSALDFALGTLPVDMREIVLLKYRDNHSCAEIAQRLDKKTNTVAKALSRAYEHLERIILEREKAQ